MDSGCYLGEWIRLALWLRLAILLGIMGYALLIGLFCFLWVVGAVFTDDPTGFAIKSMTVLAGIAFLAFILMVINALAK